MIRKLWFKIQLYRREIFLGLFLIPALIPMVVFQLYPALKAVWFSMTNIAIMGPHAVDWSFIGLKNFGYLPRDPYFPHSAKLTGYYCAASLVLRFILGFIAALFVTSSRSKWRIGLTLLFLIPYIIPGSIKPVLYLSLMDVHSGLYNRVLRALHLPPQSWTYERLTESLISLNVWAGYAFAMIILISALLSIPKEYYEIADIYGASRWTKFFRITLPLIKFPIILCLIMIFKEDIDDFTYAYVLGGGGGGDQPINFKTDILAVYAYYKAFQYGELGIGCAIGLIVGIIVFILTLAQLRMGGV